MSVAASLLSLQFACALGARFTDISHGARIADSSHGTRAGSKQCDSLDQRAYVSFIRVPHIDNDVLLAPWFIDDFLCPTNARKCFHKHKMGQYQSEAFVNTETLRVTEDGLVIQLAAEVSSAYFHDGPECVRISSSPKCEDEGEIVDASERSETKTTLLKSKTMVTLKHQAILDGDHAVGNWSGWYGDSLTISAPAQERVTPKFLSITRSNGSGQANQWYGDLGEPDERQIRWVTLSGPYTPAADEREFGVRQLTGNSIEYFAGEYSTFQKFAVREYETTIPLMASAFVCGRSNTSSPWEPLTGFTWNYQSKTSPDQFGPDWRRQSFGESHWEPSHYDSTRKWYYIEPARTTSLSPSTTTTKNKATLASTMHLGATLLTVMIVIGSSH